MMLGIHKPVVREGIQFPLYALPEAWQQRVHGIGIAVACVLVQLKKGTSHGCHNDSNLRNDNASPSGRYIDLVELRCIVLDLEY